MITAECGKTGETADCQRSVVFSRSYVIWSPRRRGGPDVEVSEFMEHAVLFCIDIDTRRFTALVVLAEEDVPFKRQTHEIGAVAYEILRIKLHRGFGHSALRFLPPLPEGASYVNAER